MKPIANLFGILCLMSILACGQPQTLPKGGTGDSGLPAGATILPDTRKTSEMTENGKIFTFKQVGVKYSPPAPAFPAEVKALGIQGTVKVMVVVDSNGFPVKAIAQEGPKELYNVSELYAIKWRFYPAELDGVPQVARFIITLPFKLIE